MDDAAAARRARDRQHDRQLARARPDPAVHGRRQWLSIRTFPSTGCHGFQLQPESTSTHGTSHPKTPIVARKPPAPSPPAASTQTDKLRNWVSAYDLNHTRGPSSRKNGGNSMPRAISWPAALPGPASIIAASPRPTAGPPSTRNSASWTCADFPRTTSTITRPGGARSRYCICSRIGIGSSAKASRSPVWVHSNLDEVELFLNGRAKADRKFSR